MRYSLLLLSCIFLYGISTFFKKIALNKIHPFQFEIIVAVIYAIALPIWIYTLYDNKSNESYDLKSVSLSVVCIVVGMVATILFNFLLKESRSPGTVTALVSLSPIVTLFLSYMFLQEKLTIFKILAFILALVSAILINY